MHVAENGEIRKLSTGQEYDLAALIHELLDNQLLHNYKVNLTDQQKKAPDSRDSLLLPRIRQKLSTLKLEKHTTQHWPETILERGGDLIRIRENLYERYYIFPIIRQAILQNLLDLAAELKFLGLSVQLSTGYDFSHCNFNSPMPPEASTIYHHEGKWHCSTRSQYGYIHTAELHNAFNAVTKSAE